MAVDVGGEVGVLLGDVVGVAVAAGVIIIPLLVRPGVGVARAVGVCDGVSVGPAVAVGETAIVGTAVATGITVGSTGAGVGSTVHPILSRRMIL